MSIAMHQITAPVFVQGLRGLSVGLDKSIAYCTEKKVDQAAFLQARLFPDMFNFTRQVQISCDFAKGPIARLAGEEPPVYADDETTLEALKARVEKTIAYIEGVAAARIDGSEDRTITLVRRGVSSDHNGLDYVLLQATPNFYFHITTAYALLRHNGVDVGKRDYLAAS